jgi:two-component system phosphate regulon sensor histidine kinase PhoR
VKKAIYQKFIIILILALVLCGSIFGASISNVIRDRTRDDMLYILRVVDHTIQYNEEFNPQLIELKDLTNSKRIRFTILDLDGNVLADSDVKNYTAMENHSSREEVKEAMQDGTGVAMRYSDTINVPLLYVAHISSNGNYILRISIPYSVMKDFMGAFLPTAFISIGVALVVSAFLANGFSKSITKPLNEIAGEMRKLKEENPEFNFPKCQYDEINTIADTTMQMAKSVKEYMDQIEFEKMVRQEFFANASHELKTPITSIKGYTELLENGMVRDDTMKKDFFSRIKKETDNMTNLINDILMISRLETKEAEVVISEVRISPLVKEVCDSLEPLAKECLVSMELNCRPLVMHANTQQLRELFNNLITNAIKYNKPGGKVDIVVTSEQNEIIITVEDTGVGIPEDAKQRVFERFYRVDKGRSKKMGGTGLGLSIVKHVVNYYNGSITLESKLSVGTKITVRLPMK